MKKIYFIFGLVIVLLIIILVFRSTTYVVEVKKLTEDDFKIISASWNNFREYNGKFTDIPIDWDKSCAGEYGNEFISSGYSLVVQQNYDLSCYYILNGEEKKNSDGSFNLFEKNRRVDFGYLNLNFKRDNQIVICCHMSAEEENEICKSVLLPAKCK